MAKALTPEEAITRAKALQDDRLNAIRVVATARQTVVDVRDKAAAELAEVQARLTASVTAAENEDVRAYAAALAAGWTPDELRRIGFTEPDKKARVRRRASRRPANSGPRVTPSTAGPERPAVELIDEKTEPAPVGD